MDITNFFLLLAVAGILWNIVTAIAINNELQHTHLVANMATTRFAPWKRLAEYKKLTKTENGKTGGLYYQYTASILLTGISGVILLILLIAG